MLRHHRLGVLDHCFGDGSGAGWARGGRPGRRRPRPARGVALPGVIAGVWIVVPRPVLLAARAGSWCVIALLMAWFAVAEAPLRRAAGRDRDRVGHLRAAQAVPALAVAANWSHSPSQLIIANSALRDHRRPSAPCSDRRLCALVLAGLRTPCGVRPAPGRSVRGRRGDGRPDEHAFPACLADHPRRRSGLAGGGFGTAWRASGCSAGRARVRSGPALFIVPDHHAWTPERLCGLARHRRAGRQRGPAGSFSCHRRRRSDRCRRSAGRRRESSGRLVARRWGSASGGYRSWSSVSGPGRGRLGRPGSRSAWATRCGYLRLQPVQPPVSRSPGRAGLGRPTA